MTLVPNQAKDGYCVHNLTLTQECDQCAQINAKLDKLCSPVILDIPGSRLAGDNSDK